MELPVLIYNTWTAAQARSLSHSATRAPRYWARLPVVMAMPRAQLVTDWPPARPVGGPVAGRGKQKLSWVCLRRERRVREGGREIREERERGKL